MTTVDLAAFDPLISALREAGWHGQADQLEEAVQKTAYRTSSEIVREISVAVKAAAHAAGEHPPNHLDEALRMATQEIVKIWREFKLSGK